MRRFVICLPLHIFIMFCDGEILQGPARIECSGESGWRHSSGRYLPQRNVSIAVHLFRASKRPLKSSNLARWAALSWAIKKLNNFPSETT